MTATISSLKKECWPLTRYYLRRNIPAALVFFAASFLIFPLQYILEVFQRFPEDLAVFYELYGPAHIHTPLAHVAFPGMMVVLPVLLTLVQVHWLHSRQGTDLYHSLPVSRESLLLANAGAVFLTIAIPVTADYFIIAVAGSIRRGMMTPGDPFFFPRVEMALDYLGWMVTTLALIAVTLVVATQVGSVFENLVFTVELLCAPAGIYMMFFVYCSQYLAGYGAYGGFNEVLLSSPATVMIVRYLLYRRNSPTQNWVILLWGVLAALLLWAACRLYRRRPSEMAGTSGAREPLNTLGPLALVYMGGLGLAFILYWFVNESHFPLWLGVLLCSLLVAAVCQLVLGRGLRGLKKRLPAMAAMVAVTTFFAFAVSHGGLGYSTYIPKDPESVTLTFRGRYGVLAERVIADSESVNDKGEYSYDSVGAPTFTTPEGIALVTDLHRTLAQQLLELDIGNFIAAGVMRFGYSDGTVRHFSQHTDNKAFFSPRPIQPILALEESRELREQTDPRFTLTAEEVKAVRVSDATGLVTGNPVTDPEAIRRLVEAMRQDAEAFDPTILRDGSARAVAYLNVETLLPKDGYWSNARIDRDCWRSFSLPVYPADANTYQALWTVMGCGEFTGRLYDDKVAALDIEWWGAPCFTREAYWVGTGPQSLFPTRSPGDPLPSLDNDFVHKRLRVTDPGEIQGILDSCLGRDCHLADTEGYIVTVEGKDRTGSSFWLTVDEVPDRVRDLLGEKWSRS